MPQIDPKITFYIGLVTCVALILSTATVWTGAIPAGYVDEVVAWNGLIGKIGTGVMTFLSGVSSAAPGPLASK